MGSKLVLVGEAWGREEEEAQAPFVGASGRLLNGMLASMGIDRHECFVTNVVNQRPKPTNDVKNLCGTRAEGVVGYPALVKGKYLLARYQPELDRLFKEIEREKPNLVLALGATSAWALLRTTGIKAIRGAPVWSEAAQVKVLPTYHPAAIMRDWSLRPVVLADLEKAKREAAFPEVRRPRREIYVEPSLADLATFEREHLAMAKEISLDIETKGDQITCIGFAPSPSLAIVVPFWTTSGSYWPTQDEEVQAWRWVKRICERPDIRYVGQNGLYDLGFLWRRYGIKVPGYSDDTMLLHHALQPEMEKGLGFLGSVYTDEASWKFMRHEETVKRED
jgi:uracil-DNA glycosylase